MKNRLFPILLSFLIFSLFSFTPAKEKSLKIALSQSSPNYTSWINKGDSSIITIDLHNLTPLEAIKRLHDCSALILTGGGDIDPTLYKNNDNAGVCQDIDQNRDRLEKALINEALAMKMPILGICRGEQMLNVVLGGSLISDISSFKKSHSQAKKLTTYGMNTGMETAIAIDADRKIDSTKVIHQCADYTNCYHSVRLVSTSLLRTIIGADTGFVTSNHHQAILRWGEELKINAQSPDGMIEGIEWKNQQGKSFMLGVQWHPERMDISNAFSGRLLQRFLAEAKIYASKLQKVK
jgi:putative glutamine amidotransferase